jgi:hypothetical protein
MEEPMNTSRLPRTDSIQELASFRDTHDVTEFDEELEDVSERVFERDVDITVQLKTDAAKAVREMAKLRGVPDSELICEWILEKIAGSDVVAALASRLASYPETGDYPFLIGDAETFERMNAAAEFNDQSVDDIIRGSSGFDLEDWIADRRAEAEEYEFSSEDTPGTWPGEVTEKGAVSLHRDVLSGKIHQTCHPLATLGCA